MQTGWSQEARGTILGRVTDSSGAIVPNATVEISNLATGITTKQTTNESGNYQAPFCCLPIIVTAEATGFKKSVRDGIELRVNDRFELNFALTIGETTDTVTVTAKTPLRDTASASVGIVVGSTLRRSSATRREDWPTMPAPFHCASPVSADRAPITSIYRP